MVVRPPYQQHDHHSQDHPVQLCFQGYLHLVARHHVEIARLLIEHGADIGSLDETQRTNILSAAHREDAADLVRLLEATGAEQAAKEADWEPEEAVAMRI